MELAFDHVAQIQHAWKKLRAVPTKLQRRAKVKAANLQMCTS